MMKLLPVVIIWINLLIFGSVWCMPMAYAETGGIVHYDSEGRRDPFVTLISSQKSRSGISGLYGVESVEDINLEGLVYDPQAGSIAIANGVVVREHETHDGVEVVAIKVDGVIFVINGEKTFKKWLVEDK